MDELSSAGVWKFIAGVLATALFTLIVAYPRDSVSRADFEQFKREERESTERLRIEQATKDATLTTQITQLQIDTTKIAAHLGVPASPGGH
jgi:hypothetical protein